MRSPCPRNKIAVIVVVGCASVWGLWGLNAQTSRSTWDGVYTKEQAERGKAIYVQHCSACHGADLNGVDAAPALTGGTFLSNWNTLTVGDLFERIHVSMPADKPGSLSRQQTADVLAYVLSFDEFPSGNSDLEAQTQILKQIRFDAYKP